MAKKNKIADVTVKIVDLLDPLESDDRHRVVQAAFTLLGEKPVDLSNKATNKSDQNKKENEEDVGDLPANAKRWVQQNQLTSAELDQVFHTTPEGTDVIGETHRGHFKLERVGTYPTKKGNGCCRSQVGSYIVATSDAVGD